MRIVPAGDRRALRFDMASEITLSCSDEMAARIAALPWACAFPGDATARNETLAVLTRTMLDARHAMFIAWGPDLAWLYNDAFIPIMGDKHPAALGSPAREVWQEAWATLEPMFNQVLAGEPVLYEDFTLPLARHGRIEDASFHFSYNPLRDATGAVRGVLGVVTETTDKLQALRQVAGQREQMDRVFENEALLRFIDLLARATSTSGSADDILAITTRMVGEHLRIANCAYADMDADEDGFTIRGDWSAPGSASIVGHYSLAAFGAQAVAMLSTGQPFIITDNAQQLVPHEARMFQSLGIAATICMPLVKEGRLKALMAIHDNVPHQWSDAELKLVREVTERSWAHVERVGVEANLRVSAQALSDLNASLERRVEERTTQLMQVEEVLRQAQKMEAVGQLTGGIAHDFNNLLAAISGNLELLERRIAEGDVAGLSRYVDNARGAARRAAALTQRLLAFARRQTLDPRPTDVNDLIRGMEELVRHTVGPDIELVIVAPPELWPARIDPAQLESSLINLCINARDAMVPHGGRITIETCNHSMDEGAARERDIPPGEYVSICVIDTGTGMTPEVIARAFDPFFTTKPLGEGTGLGLSMVYGFARQSGGQVRITSEVGHGTTLCVYLPRHVGDIDTVAATGTQAAGHGDGETVLVIDDEPAIRALIVEVLNDCGYVTLQAQDGPSGLRTLASTARVDLLVTDVGLPGGMNGRQVADAARISRPDLKVLFITGYAANAAVGDGRLAHGMEVLTKPFTITDLANKIGEMCKRG